MTPSTVPGLPSLGAAPPGARNAERANRAQGGPVYPGRSYLVNENPNAIVPEVFVPDVAGRILNAGGQAGAASAPVSISQAFTVTGSPDAATLALLGRVAKKAAADGVREAVAGVTR